MGNQQSCQLLPWLILKLRSTWAPSGALSFRGVGNDMDSIRGVLRSGLWFCVLLCVLPVTQAATTVPVTVPSAHATIKNSSGVTVSGNSLKATGPIQGTFIPKEGAGTRVSLKVKPVVDFSVPRTINAIKPLVRGGFAGALATAGVVWAINQLPGASFDPLTGQPVVAPVLNTDATYWLAQNAGTSISKRRSTALASCKAIGGTESQFEFWVVTSVSTTSANCVWRIMGTGDQAYGPTYKVNKTCPNGFNSTTFDCLSTAQQPRPFNDADYSSLETRLDTIVNPEWLREILLTSCAGAPNPETCADGLKDYQDKLLGPSTVPGGSTTTTSTYVKPDGTVGTKGSTTTTNYNIKYGPTSFTFNKTQTTTHTQDGVETGQETTEETEEPLDEVTPPEEDQEEPSPCTTDCDGPAYEDLYEPTDDTKEDHLDSYSDRVSSIPIISAVGSLFDVSVSAGSCPAWSYSSTLDLGVASMPIDLNFDYHCLPWFVSLGPWIQTIFLLGCTLGAIRIGLL